MGNKIDLPVLINGIDEPPESIQLKREIKDYYLHRMSEEDKKKIHADVISKARSKLYVNNKKVNITHVRFDINHVIVFKLSNEKMVEDKDSITILYRIDYEKKMVGYDLSQGVIREYAKSYTSLKSEYSPQGFEVFNKFQLILNEINKHILDIIRPHRFDDLRIQTLTLYLILKRCYRQIGKDMFVLLCKVYFLLEKFRYREDNHLNIFDLKNLCFKA